MNAGRENEDARSVLQTLKMIEYHYSAPARDVITQLRLFPRARRGAQRLLRRECEVWPRPDRTRRFTDQFGNEVWEFLHREVVDNLRFSLDFVTEHRLHTRPGRPAVSRVPASSGVPRLKVVTFLEPTPLVDTSATIDSAARRLAGTRATAGELME